MPDSPYSLVQENLDRSNRQLDLIKNNIQLQAPAPQNQMAQNLPTWNADDILGSPKQSSQEFSNITLASQYEELNSGERIAKFPNYSTYLNSEELLAQNQSTGEKWKNGLTKFIGKTGVAAIGGTIGVVNDLVAGINQGSMEAAYNSDLSKWLDDLNTKLDYKLPNYYTQQERGEGFLSSTTNANFWANDVLGGLSFTTGAILSEGIWAAATGGTSLLSSAGRWSTKAIGAEKTFKALNQWKAISKAPFVESFRAGENAVEGVAEITDAYKTAVNTLSKGKKLGDQTRFFFTSAGYEAAVEARHYMKETEEKWLQDFKNGNGRTPSVEEMSKFKEGLTNSANAVFLTNLPLIGASNAITFGKLALGKSVSEGVSDNFLKRNLFGVGFEKGIDGTFTAVKSSAAQKIAGKTWGIAKYGLLEGVVEEGGQSIITGTAQNYILKGYDENNLKTTYDLADAMYDAVSHTYGTSEGFKEVGIGILIGILGGGVSDATTGAGFFNSVGQERSEIETAVEYRNGFTAQTVIDRLKSSSRIMDAQNRSETAANRNDLTGQIISDKEAMLISIARDEKFQGVDQGKLDFAQALNQTPNAEMAQALSIPVGEIPAWKETKINEYNNLADTHVKNLQFADSLLGSTKIAGFNQRSDLREAIAANFTLGENSLKLSQDYTRLIKTNVANINANNAVDVDFVLDQIATNKKQNYNSKAKQVEVANKRFEQVAKRVVNLEQSSSTDNESYKTELTSARKELIELESQMNQLETEKQTAFAALGVENFASGTLITPQMLDSQNANIAELGRTLQDIKQTDPQRHAMIEKLIYEQSKAVRYAKELDIVSRKILDPQTRVKTIDGWVDNLALGRKQLNESTAAFFSGTLDSYRTSIDNATTVDSQASITQNTYIAFQNGVQPSPQYLQELQDKVKEGTSLNKMEQEMYDTNQVQAVENDEDSIPAPEVIRTPTESVQGKIDNILNSEQYLPIYTGNNAQELQKNQTTQEDKDRYQELEGKIPLGQKENWQLYLYNETPFSESFGLTQEEANELQILNQKLNDWKLLDGVRDEDSSVAEWMSVLNDMNAPNPINEVKTEFDTKDYVSIAKSEEIPVNTSNGVSVSTLNVPDKVGVVKTGKQYEFSFINIQSFQKLFPGSQLMYVEKNGAEKVPDDKLLKKYGKKEGQKFKLRIGEKGLLFTIGQRSRINVDIEQFDAVAPQSTMKIAQFGSEKFALVYNTLDSGELIPMESDFTFKTTNGQNFVNKQLLNSLPSGTQLRTVVDSDSSYNQQLFDDLKAAEKKFNSEKINEQELNEVINYVKANLEIYAYANNEFVGSMRSLGDKVKMDVSVERNSQLRNKAFELLQVNEFKGQIDLQQTLALNAVLLAPPNLRMNNDATVQNIDFTEEALQNVVGTGYIQDGQVSTVFNQDKLNTTYIKPISAKNNGQKIPFVIVRLGETRNVAYPITLNKTTVDKSQPLIEILNSPDISKANKAGKFIITMKENGIANNRIDFTLEDWWIGNAEVDSSLEKLANVEQHLDINTLSGKVSNEILANSAQISVDLSNIGNAFSAGKPLITISEVKPYDGLQTLNEQYGNVEEQRTALERDLSNDLVEMYAEVNSNPAFEKISNKFTDVFDEADVDTMADSYTSFRKNIKILRNALNNVTPNVKKILGAENLTELNNKLASFDALQKKEKNIKIEIRSKEIENQLENSKTNC